VLRRRSVTPVCRACHVITRVAKGAAEGAALVALEKTKVLVRLEAEFERAADGQARAALSLGCKGRRFTGSPGCALRSACACVSVVCFAAQFAPVGVILASLRDGWE
jgi:hypothetical protein